MAGGVISGEFPQIRVAQSIIRWQNLEQREFAIRYVIVTMLYNIYYTAKYKEIQSDNYNNIIIILNYIIYIYI